MKKLVKQLIIMLAAVVLVGASVTLSDPVTTPVQAARHYRHRRHYHLRHRRHYRHRPHHYHHTAYYWAHHKRRTVTQRRYRHRPHHYHHTAYYWAHHKRRTVTHKRHVRRHRHYVRRTITRPTASQLAYIYKRVHSQVGAMKANGHGAFIVNGNHSKLTAKNSMKEFAANTRNANGTAGTANAFLTHHSRQYKNRSQTGNGATSWRPLGWHQLTHLRGTYHYAYNRGHLLGYALVGNIAHYNASESNAKNIVTQTSWANQANSATNTGQNYYEGIVRRALDRHKKVRYQVRPIYDRAHHNLVPYAVQIQAKATDGSVNFNVVVPNVQGNININYKNGVATRR